MTIFLISSQYLNFSLSQVAIVYAAGRTDGRSYLIGIHFPRKKMYIFKLVLEGYRTARVYLPVAYPFSTEANLSVNWTSSRYFAEIRLFPSYQHEFCVGRDPVLRDEVLDVALGLYLHPVVDVLSYSLWIRNEVHGFNLILKQVCYAIPQFQSLRNEELVSRPQLVAL